MQPSGLAEISERDLSAISLNSKILNDSFCFQERNVESTSSKQYSVVCFSILVTFLMILLEVSTFISLYQASIVCDNVNKILGCIHKNKQLLT